MRKIPSGILPLICLFGVPQITFASEASYLDRYLEGKHPETAALVSLTTVDQAFDHAYREFSWRWNEFSSGRRFTPFSPSRSSRELEKEFVTVQQTRVPVWFEDISGLEPVSAPDYSMARDLLLKDRVRVPICTAFQYNRCSDTYNGSNVVLGKRRFIAMEGPRTKDVDKFFKLLTYYRITHLVRLTAESHNQVEKCSPYWRGRNYHPRSDHDAIHQRLAIPRHHGSDYIIQYFVKEDWEPQHAPAVDSLIAMANIVRRSADNSTLPIACHCSAGSGRVGTFIAAVTLLDVIDQQLADGKAPDAVTVSVEEVVFKLSLQRIHAVSHATQYIALYRLVERYLDIKRQSLAATA